MTKCLSFLEQENDFQHFVTYEEQVKISILELHKLKYREAELFTDMVRFINIYFPKKPSHTFLHPKSQEPDFYTFWPFQSCLHGPLHDHSAPEQWIWHLLKDLYPVDNFRSIEKDSPHTSPINGWHNVNVTGIFPGTFHFLLSRSRQRSFWI